MTTANILTLFLLSCWLIRTDISESDGAMTKIHVTESSFILLDGLYVGLKEMCWRDSSGKKDCYIDPSRPKRKWYHLTYLKIRGDSVFLDQSPISIGRKRDTLWSASDGAFYYYSGTIEKNDSIITFNLKELFCDYCAIPVNIEPDGSREVIKRTKQFKGRIIDTGILIEGQLFIRKEDKESLISEQAEARKK